VEWPRPVEWLRPVEWPRHHHGRRRRQEDRRRRCEDICPRITVTSVIAPRAEPDGEPRAAVSEPEGLGPHRRRPQTEDTDCQPASQHHRSTDRLHRNAPFTQSPEPPSPPRECMPPTRGSSAEEDHPYYEVSRKREHAKTGRVTVPGGFSWRSLLANPDPAP